MITFFYTADKPNTPQTDIYKSLGGYISTTEITDDALQNVFDMVSAYGVATRNYPRYACIAIRNDSPSPLTNVRFYFEPVGNEIMCSYKVAFVLPNGQGLLPSSANVTTRPPLVKFEDATLEAPNVLGDIAAGQVIGMFLERRITTVEFEPVLPFDQQPKEEGVNLVFVWD